jgi:hypothetical protein
MTAMALLALGRIGVDPSDRTVRLGLQYLKAGRNEWYKPGKEIDCAQAIEAALVLGGSWRDFSSELRSLLNWAQDRRAWADTRALASDLQDESSKVPAVVSALIGIIWETVRSELPLLLQGVSAESGLTLGLTLDSTTLASQLYTRLDRLAETIDQHVREREMVVARPGVSPEVRASLDSWREHARYLARLRQKLHGLAINWQADDAEIVLSDINVLGMSVFGAAWEPVGVEP